MLLTFTRNAYVGLVAALLLYRRRRAVPGLLLGSSPRSWRSSSAPPARIRERIRSIADLSDSTNRDRIAMAHAGARMVARQPGLRPRARTWSRRTTRSIATPDALHWNVPHLHNNVVQIAAANGLFAAAAYLAIVAHVPRARDCASCAAGTARARGDLVGRPARRNGAHVAGLFEYNFGDTEVEMATLFIFGLPFSRAAAADRAAVANVRARIGAMYPQPVPAAAPPRPYTVRS